MSNYSTVRIDIESKKKLEEIADQIGSSLNIHISKATALQIVINEAHETTVAGPRRFVEDLMIKNNEKDRGNENG